MCPIDGCRSVVKQIHNHLTDAHNKKRGSKEYKYRLKITVIYQGKDISESSESTPDSSSSEDVKETTRGMQILINPKNVESFINKFTAAMRKVLEVSTLAIFQNQTVEQETLANSPMLFSEEVLSCSHQFESPGDEVEVSDLDGEFVDDGDDDGDDDGEFVDDLMIKKMTKVKLKRRGRNKKCLNTSGIVARS